MRKCQHLIENRIYLISTKSVEGIKAFKNHSEKRKIKGAINKYLGVICNVMQINISDSEIHLLIQLRDRKPLENFFKEKHKDKVKEDFFIPKSTYIFGRQMSNLLVSFVKYYNIKHKRKGILIDGRYRRHIIESERELQQISTLLKSGNIRIKGESINFSDLKTKDHVDKVLRGIDKVDIDNKEPNLFSYYSFNGSQIDLRGCFILPIKRSLRTQFLSQLIKSFRINHPCGPNYN